MIRMIYPHGVVEIENSNSDTIFKDNKQRLKPILKSLREERLD
jgi:hypothetical protein